jgi:hypothetical protein
MGSAWPCAGSECFVRVTSAIAAVLDAYYRVIAVR